jgi:hypothetical protein
MLYMLYKGQKSCKTERDSLSSPHVAEPACYRRSDHLLSPPIALC